MTAELLNRKLPMILMILMLDKAWELQFFNILSFFKEENWCPKTSYELPKSLKNMLLLEQDLNPPDLHITPKGDNDVTVNIE